MTGGESIRQYFLLSSGVLTAFEEFGLNTVFLVKDKKISDEGHNWVSLESLVAPASDPVENLKCTKFAGKGQATAESGPNPSPR